MEVEYGTNATPPAIKDRVFDCSDQLRLTELQAASGAPSWMARSSTGEHFCPSEFQGTVKNPAYGRQSISRPMRIVAPMPKEGGPRQKKTFFCAAI